MLAGWTGRFYAKNEEIESTLMGWMDRYFLFLCHDSLNTIFVAKREMFSVITESFDGVGHGI